MELRCPNGILFGVVDHGEEDEPGTIEVLCRSRRCGKQPGVAVVHRFDLETGEVSTRRYQEIPDQNER